MLYLYATIIKHEPSVTNPTSVVAKYHPHAGKQLMDLEVDEGEEKTFFDLLKDLLGDDYDVLMSTYDVEVKIHKEQATISVKKVEHRPVSNPETGTLDRCKGPWVYISYSLTPKTQTAGRFHFYLCSTQVDLL